MDINKIKADHPFLNYDHKEYFEEFLKRISSLKHIMSSNIEAKVEEKMKYKDEASFWQSIAEIIIWFLCESKEKDYMIDYPTKGGKNCDVSFLIDDMRINIEVKCPQIIVDRKQINYDATKMILQPILPYRYEITRNEVESVYDEIEREFKNTGLGIAPIEFPDDNPLFQAIAKASEQLPDLDDKTYNIVFISTIQSQMEKYWRYLTIIEGYTALLPDIGKVRDALGRLPIDTYDWRDNPNVRYRIKQLAEAEYNAGGSDKVLAKIDAMDDRLLKQYLKRLVKDSISVGIEILLKEGGGQ